MTRVRDERWGVGLVGTLGLTALGLLFASPVLLTGAVIPLTYVLFGIVSTVPSDAAIAVERSFGRPDPAPGEAVEVTLTVENAGESVLTDVRVIDGVPDELAVTQGSPRGAVSLSPGETASVSYTVVAKRGEYAFDDPVVRLRSLAASERESLAVSADGDTSLRGANAVTNPPVDDATLPRAGTLPTDSGGSGLEFYATRQYQSGDPMNRIDWRHYAKTGEFITVQYRQEQAIRTVLVVDARPVGRVTPIAGYPTGAELSAYAAERLYDALGQAGVDAGVTAVGVGRRDLGDLVGPDGLPWVPPDAGANQRGRARKVLRGVQEVSAENAADAEHAPPTATAADGGSDRLTRRVLARLPPNAQVVLATPLMDNWPVAFARALAVRGFPQVVVTPDVAGHETPGQQVSAIQRSLRIRELEGVGATTVSWDLDQPIDYALRLSMPHLLSQR